MLDWFTGAFESAKAARDIGNALITIREERLIKERVFELNNTLFDIQQRLLEAQQNQFDLQKQVFALEQQIQQAANAQDVKARYRLATFTNGTRVYVLRAEFCVGQERQYFCTQCFEHDGKAITLQESRMNHRLNCPTCQTKLYYAGPLPSE